MLLLVNHGHVSQDGPLAGFDADSVTIDWPPANLAVHLYGVRSGEPGSTCPGCTMCEG
jgi:hypothetical protein